MIHAKFVLEARMTPVLVEEVEVDPGAQELITCINILLEPAVVAKLVNPSLNATYVNSLEHLRKTVGESPTKPVVSSARKSVVHKLQQVALSKAERSAVFFRRHFDDLLTSLTTEEGQVNKGDEVLGNFALALTVPLVD
jgi:hypothetical protein